MEPLLYTVDQAANQLGVSRNTVYNMVTENRIPYMRLPSLGKGKGDIRIPREALEKWIAEGVTHGNTQISHNSR